MSRMWIAFATAITVGSLYPFDFQAKTLDAATIQIFLASCCQKVAPWNALGNAVAFAPLGYLGMVAANSTTSPAGRALLIIVSGTALALALQVAQVFLPSRYEGLQDVAWNFVGLVGGTLLGALLLERQTAIGDARAEVTSNAATAERFAAASHRVPVTVNLRRTQAAFLEQLAEEMGVDTSEACRQVIVLMLKRTKAAADGPTARAKTPASEAQPGWTRYILELDRELVEALTTKAEKSGLSLSGFIRRLLATFMESYGRASKVAAAKVPYGQSTRRRTTDREKPASRRGKKRSGKSGPPFPWSPPIALSIGALVAIGALLSSAFVAELRGPQLVTTVAWADRPASILFDHHSHTEHSDGALSVADLARLASNAGCHALAITDHSDGKGTASPAQLEEFHDVRLRYREFLLFGGVEINMPSYGGREHVSAIVHPDIEHKALPLLRDAAESSMDVARAGQKEPAEAQADWYGPETQGAHPTHSKPKPAGSDEPVLRSAMRFLERGDSLVMIYNNPSREDSRAQENDADILKWSSEAPLLIGFAGAPGHQNARRIGGYRKPLLTIDRWDPVVAEVGGTWDRLLSMGHQFWGAIAGSDFHNYNRDRIPCEFARTHIAARDFGYEDVLAALRAGTFWADHGKILHELSFYARVPDLIDAVYPGSVVSLAGQESPIEIRVDLLRGPGATGSPLQVELIGNCRTGKVELIATERLGRDQDSTEIEITPSAPGADNESCFVRARVRLEMDEAPDLVAYTNHIRFQLD